MRTRLLAALAAFAFTGSFAQAPAGDATKGKALYMKNMCWTCHGTAGQGGDRGSGARIAYEVLPWEGFVHQMRRPREVMPRYDTQHVSDAEFADIYAYIVSLKPGAKAKDIPLLKE